MHPVKQLGVLLKMQLRSMVDLSFLKSKRAFILKMGLAVLLFAVVTAAFYGVFTVGVMLSVFSFGGGVPITVVTVVFTLIEIMSIFSCTVGLSRSLYRAGDNVILLVLPVTGSLVFLSKLIVYYLFELKKSFPFFVPLFLAYGIVNGAVWFYYPWMLFAFLIVCLVPVAIGAVLSIPALYLPKLLQRVPVLKYLLIVAVTASLAALAFLIVGRIPENINLLGQWGSITLAVREFLNGFARIFSPFHYLTQMVAGGTLEIARNPIGLRTLFVLLAVLGISAVLIGVSFFTARVLFLKLTARAGENEKRTKKHSPNRVTPRLVSPLAEDLVRTFRSGKAVMLCVLEFFIPAFLIFTLNKMYAAMSTSYTGQTMTAAFNILMLLVTVLTSNAYLAHAYSRDGAARNLIKTRPADFRLLLVSRLLLRAVLSTLSILLAVLLFGAVSGAPVSQTAGFLVMAVCLNLAHILWSAEIDVMNPEAVSSSKNSALATTFGVIISVLFALGYYLLAGSGGTSAFWKLAVLAVLFLGLRAFLYFERVRIYFVEK